MEFWCKHNRISQGLKIANWSGFKSGLIIAVKDETNQNLTYSKCLNLVTLKYLSTSFPNKNLLLYFESLEVSFTKKIILSK